MLSFIEGHLTEKNPAYVVMENHGLGYLVHISLNTYIQIKDLERARLFIHMTIKNEASTPVGLSLYGFSGEEERETFRKLISVSGVGNSTAMLVLSSLTPRQLYEAIASGNVSLLQSVKGIGAKTAQRILIDLKDKAAVIEIGDSGYNTKRIEALSGLVVLGFSKAAAEKALNKVMEAQGPSLPVERMIKEALKII
ncbi:MAG: Holliday junction branch migration protein RuvA [Bacteroidales bacterium]|nr:Holliday junction branch migration protein RuvA [Bacteroidales bacterium]